MGLIEGFLESSTNEKRKGSLEQTHPVYQQYQSTWSKGLDAFDGAGGFLNGSYLWQFAREDPEQFSARRGQARYHNYTETLVDIYVRSVLSGVTRETRDSGLEEWWGDVDQSETTINDYVSSVFGQALAGGHAGVLVDKTRLEPGESQASDPNRVILRTFTSVDITDWRLDGQGLAAVKLLEDLPPQNLAESFKDEKAFLLWDRDLWIRFSPKGDMLDVDEHGLGLVPLVMVRPKPSRRHPFIGKPLIAPSVAQALYNRASEEDLVLRDQAFSLFVVELPSDTDEDSRKNVQQQLNQGTGTATAMVVTGTTNFRTADMQVPATIRETQQNLVAELYRMAHLRFQRESLQAESAEAIRLQRQDLDQTLTSMADDLKAAEMMIARLYFAHTSPSMDAAERAFERAQVEITYPNEFEIINVENELTTIGLAIDLLKTSKTATNELRQRVMHLTLSDVDDKVLNVIRKELLEQAATEQAPNIEQMRQRLQGVGVEVEETEEPVAAPEAAIA